MRGSRGRGPLAKNPTLPQPFTVGVREAGEIEAMAMDTWSGRTRKRVLFVGFFLATANWVRSTLGSLVMA